MHLTKNMTKGCIVSIMVVMGLIFYTHCVPVHAKKNEGLENTVYVSISGKSEGADGSLDNPFPSIEDARDYLRTKDLDAENRGLIYLCGGRYRVVESIKLTAEDSYITLAAYQGEPVEISGSLTLNNGNFKKLSEVKGDKYSSAVRLQSSVSDKVYVYDLGAENIPAGVIYKNGFNWKKQPFQSELVVDGVLQVLAQYPNSGVMTENNIGRQDFGEKVRMYYFDKTDDAKTYEEMLQMRAPVWDVNSLSPNYKSWAPPYVDNWTEEDNKAGQPDINPNTDNTRYETDGWLSGYFENNYANDRVRIYSIKDASATSNAKDWIYCKYPSMYSVTKRKGVIRLHAINLLCELDMEGEYYIDRYKGNDILYYYPKGGTIGNKSITFTAFDQPLLTLEKAEGVQICGIKFSGTTGYGITMMDCVSCAVKSCELYNISLDAIRIGMNNGTITSDPSYKTWGGGYKNLVYNCTIHDMGGGGVFLAGGDRKSLKRGDNLVRNCEFYNLSRLATYTPAVYLEGVGNTAAYNYIHDCPHMVIQIMGNDMLVTHNKIVNTCYNASDQAPIYSGRDWGWLGNQITYNYIDTVRASHGSNYGIYMDDGLSGMIIRNNIIRSVKGKAVFANKGYGHYVTDNIIIDCRSYLEVWQFVRDGKYRPVANEKVMAYRFFYGLRSYEEAVASGDEANKSTKGYYNTAENIRKWYKHYNALYNNLPDYSKKKEHAFDLSKKYLPLGFVRNKDNYSEHSMWSDKNSILVASNITAVRNILVKTGGLSDAQGAKNYNDPDTFNVKVHKADSADALGLDLATGKISIQSPLAKDKNYGSDWIKEWNGTFDVEKAGTIAGTFSQKPPTDPTKRLTVISAHQGPVVGSIHADVLLSNNRSGFETGQVVKIDGVYHMFVNEMFVRPHRDMRIAYWTSPDAVNWKRQSTLVESIPERSPTNSRSEVWVTGVEYNDEESAWNIFYVAYRCGDEEKGELPQSDYEGKIWRAKSVIKGRSGIAGPYADMDIILQPDENSQSWEGQQAVATFNPYKANGQWYAFYDGHNYIPKGPWPIGMATAPTLSGPWVRMPEGHNPVPIAEVFAENPQVTELKEGGFLTVFDSFGDQEIGYSLSEDGIHWSPEVRIKVQSGNNVWALPGDHAMRTPLCAIEEKDGTFTVIYTAKTEFDGKKFYAIGQCTLAWE